MHVNVHSSSCIQSLDISLSGILLHTSIMISIILSHLQELYQDVSNYEVASPRGCRRFEGGMQRERLEAKTMCEVTETGAMQYPENNEVSYCTLAW